MQTNIGHASSLSDDAPTAAEQPRKRGAKVQAG